jgi:hypothetical protein
LIGGLVTQASFCMFTAMKQIIIKYYTNQPMTLGEAVNVMEEYTKLIGKEGSLTKGMIDQMTNNINPFGQSMMQQAIKTSVEAVEHTLDITKVFNKDGILIKIF